MGANAGKSLVIWSRMNLVTNDSDSLKRQINEKNSQDPTFSEGVDPVVAHEIQNTNI